MESKTSAALTLTFGGIPARLKSSIVKHPEIYDGDVLVEEKEFFAGKRSWTPAIRWFCVLLLTDVLETDSERASLSDDDGTTLINLLHPKDPFEERDWENEIFGFGKPIGDTREPSLLRKLLESRGTIVRISGVIPRAAIQVSYGRTGITQHPDAVELLIRAIHPNTPKRMIKSLSEELKHLIKEGTSMRPKDTPPIDPIPDDAMISAATSIAPESQVSSEADKVKLSPKICELVTRYYAGTPSRLRQYIVTCNDRQIPTTIYTHRDWLKLDRDLRVNCASVVGPMPTPDSSLLRQRITARFGDPPRETPPIRENRPLYRLAGINPSGLFPIQFSETRFFPYLVDSGILEDELFDALLKMGGNVTAVLESKEALMPNRTAIIPQLSDLEDYKGHICAGGIGVLLALARKKPHDFRIYLQIRSNKNVIDSQGLTALVPKGFHQPLVAGNDQEAQLSLTIWKEYAEEVLGREEFRSRAKTDSIDSMLRKVPGVARLMDDEGNCIVQATSFGLNAIKGNYEFGCMLVVLDEDLFETLRDNFHFCDEVDDFQVISTIKPDEIEAALHQQWAPEAIMHFVEGLKALERLDSKLKLGRVKLPSDLSRFVGETKIP